MKRIAIITVNAGGGHLAASQAIKEYLQDDYEICEISLFNDILPRLDPICVVSRRKYTFTSFYNYFARKKQYRILNALSFGGYLIFLAARPLIRPEIAKVLKGVQPHLVISVIPLFNGLIARETDRLYIPFMVVPTDLNVEWFAACFTYFPRTIFTLSFDEVHMWRKLYKLSDHFHQIKVTGFPLKKSFLTIKHDTFRKSHFDLPDDKPIVFLMMGSEGSKALLRYVATIQKAALNVHLIVCGGKSNEVRRLLERTYQDHNMTIFGFCDNIAELMALSDVCITKPGSVTLCEALYSEIPVLLDAIGPTLQWESFNLDFVQRHKLGAVITRYHDIPLLLERLLYDEHYYKNIKKNLMAFKKENCADHLHQIVSTVLKKGNEYE